MKRFPAQKHQGSGAIVFFDGVCNVCNFAIDAILKADEAGVFKVASLQGATAKALVPKAAKDLDSIVVLVQGRELTRSDAALFIAEGLGGVFGYLAPCCKWLPRVFRDGLYTFFAKMRYRTFGQRDTCRLPSAEESSRFLP